MKWQLTNEDSGLLIREFLKEKHHFSRRILKAIIHEGGSILVNGVPQTLRYPLHADDELHVKFPVEKRANHMKPEQMDLDIVYEDETILIINKPAGIATIPSYHHPTQTIANGILSYYEQNEIPYTVHVVTRLDRDTSGLLLIAKHRYSHSLLAKSQKVGQIERIYHAIVEGIPQQKSGIIDAPIGRKPGSIIERAVIAEGKIAITTFQVIRETPQHALLALQPVTGRTHQIRVHCAYMNYPIAGDDLYGGKLDNIKRHALHCSEIQFDHPLTNEKMTFTAPLPADMDQLLNK